MKYRLDGKGPTLHGTGHFIAPNAAVIGNVVMHERSSVWFNCVLRGDADLIEIGDDLNVDLEFRFASVIEDVLTLALGEDILDGKPKGHWYEDDDDKKKK